VGFFFFRGNQHTVFLAITVAAAMAYALGTMIRAVTWKNKLLGRGLKIWGVA
jgi:hypothetical protein